MKFEQLRDIIVDTLGCDAEAVTPEASLTNDLAADSLAIMELVMALEEAAGIKIDDSELPDLKTVADIAAYLEAHQQ